MAEKENMFEKYFEYWLNEMQKVGLVRKFYKEPETIIVQDPVVVYSDVHYVRKDKNTVSHNLLNPASYTRDYDVEFHRSLLDVFIGLLVKDDRNTFSLKELHERSIGDTFYEFSYYYVMKEGFSGDYFTVSFDVKPPSSALQYSAKLGSSREFPYNQKLMLDRYDIFVNKVIPCKAKDCLFNKTFMPEKYKLTDSGKQERKLKSFEKTRSIKEWMDSLNLKPVI